ncbi:MAG: tyrosine decarboxylase MfnA [Spirochaetales bacterium]|nr:tyrosine decarboxylase MfnA [Spirochaetales bacterium]
MENFKNKKSFRETKKIIDRITKNDLSFKSGKIIGSMCTIPFKTTNYFLKRYMTVNLGDPGLFPGSAQLEQEAIKMIGKIFGAETAAGTFVTGGTEANILAMLTAKEYSKGLKKVVLPESAHFSFDKAAKLMDLELVKIPLTKEMTIDIDLAKAAIDDKTMAVVGVAGSTGLGAVDNLKALGELCRENNTYMHVDAAFGGFVLPFLENKDDRLKFDFSIPEVKSITVDPHKMGGGVIPSGCIIYRDTQTASLSEIEVTYLSGGKTSHRTIVGTRSGAATIASIATMLQKGRLDYIKTVRESIEKTQYFYEKITRSDNFESVIKPVINVIGLKSKTMPTKELHQELNRRGWAVSYFNNYLRIVMMPHVRMRDIDKFFKELESIVAKERR